MTPETGHRCRSNPNQRHRPIGQERGMNAKRCEMLHRQPRSETIYMFGPLSLQISVRVHELTFLVSMSPRPRLSFARQSARSGNVSPLLNTWLGERLVHNFADQNLYTREAIIISERPYYSPTKSVPVARACIASRIGPKPCCKSS